MAGAFYINFTTATRRRTPSSSPLFLEKGSVYHGEFLDFSVSDFFWTETFIVEDCFSLRGEVNKSFHDVFCLDSCVMYRVRKKGEFYKKKKK